MDEQRTGNKFLDAGNGDKNPARRTVCRNGCLWTQKTKRTWKKQTGTGKEKRLDYGTKRPSCYYYKGGVPSGAANAQAVKNAAEPEKIKIPCCIKCGAESADMLWYAAVKSIPIICVQFRL